MRFRFVFALSCLLAAANLAGAQTAGDWRAIETIKVGQGVFAYSAAVEDDPNDESTPRLKVIGPRGAVLLVTAEGGLEKIETALAPARPDAALTETNALQSPYGFVSPVLPGQNGAPLLIVFGRGFASDPGSIRVIGLDRAGKPELMFTDETFLPTAIADLDGDGAAELIGMHSLSQTWNECVATYDPYAVYKRAPSGKFIYALALSKRYNIDHYAGWAGKKGREDITVDRCQTPARIIDAPK